ncbi:MAG TPA: hypothetical protein PK954_10325 [Anaerolineales bacterium]|nr:hypothetical protein [Anaerolineales bacterium]
MSAVLTALFAAIFDGLRAFFSERARDDVMRRIGEAERDALINKETTDAVDRMAQANAQHRDRQSAADRLRDGSA